MKVWIKYLIIGWSIACVGIVIVSFQLMKSHFIEEDYFITATLKEPVKETLKDGREWTQTGEMLFGYGDVFNEIALTKKEFVDRMKKAKGITIESKNTVRDNLIYIVLPIYVFTIWAIPILVFSLVGLIFDRGKKPQMKEEPGK
jgi:hypothetical protein